MLSISTFVILSLSLIWVCTHVFNKAELEDEKVTPLTDYEKDIIRSKIINLKAKDKELFNDKIFELLNYKTVIMPLNNRNNKDNIVSSNGEKIFIDFKHTDTSNSINKSDAQKLCGAMASNNISKGVLFTLNGSNKNCKNYCNKIKGKTIKIDSIEVIDLLDLMENCSEETAYDIFKILNLNRGDFINSDKIK